jgi:CDP-diacylglycerol--glycerol-3-phosphate 3-phosphatidyltransferase
MLNPRDIIKEKISAPLRILATKALLPAGVTANQITITGFLVTCIGAGFIVQGSLFPAGCTLLIGASLDMLDGIIARSARTASNQGALLDSFVDRVSEAIIFICISTYYLLAIDFLDTMGKIQVLTVFIAFASSLMVSYLRAKGESLGVTCSVGWMTRPERMILIVLGLLTSPWFPQTLFLSILVIAVGSVIVSGQRFRVIWQGTRVP